VDDPANDLDLIGRCVGSSSILIRPIARGATGVVWRGVDRGSGEPVAVKMLAESLLRQPDLIDRFIQERTILLLLRHRNVVRVRDLFTAGDSLGLVMDLVPGGSLREHLSEHGPLSPAEVVRLAAQVAAALTEAHELGIVHRDLKPGNILLDRDDSRLTARLTDFGVSRAATSASIAIGTAHYRSPEVLQGAPADSAADVYAFGVLLFELLTGRPPYDCDSIPELLRRQLEGSPQHPPGVPDALWTVIVSCLARKPRLRPTAAELMAELSDLALAPSEPPPAPPAEPRAEPRPEPPAEPYEEPGSSPAVVPAPRGPGKNNQVPSWRWGRPGAWGVLIGGAMVASVVATVVCHLS
jgi:serine/threonine protein kinase